MGKIYQHLFLEERSLIQTQLSMGFSPAAIAAGLKRARSTVTREMYRNGWRPAVQRAHLGRPPIAGGTTFCSLRSRPAG
jgi:IS30 family transposase